jgi:ribosomal protein L22
MSEEKTPKTDAEGAGPEKAEKEAADAKKATGKRKAAKKADAPEPKAAKKPRAKRKPKAEAAQKTEDPPAAEPKATKRKAAERKGAEPKAAAPEAADKPPAEKPAPRRSRGAETGQPPVVRARARYVRSSARKARLVCDQIRGKSVEDARAILAMTGRAAARDWSKLLESAVANAENNHELVGDELRIRSVTADEGPTLKRYRPRAMGRATRIRKRTSHLTIQLTPKE